MKRSLSLEPSPQLALIMAGTSIVAGTYGLIRLAYGLYLSDIQASLHLSSSAVGYISSGASVAYSAGALVGLIVERRPRLLVLAALLTGTVGSAGMALAPSASTFVPTAILASAGAGLASPGMVGIVARNVDAQDRGHAQAVVNSGTGPGLVAAGALALVLLPQWRAGFVIGAVFTALAGAAVLLLDRRPAMSAPHEPEAPAGGVGWRFVSDLGRPAVGALLLGVASAAVWTYGRTQLVEQGFGGTWSTIGWMAVGLGGTATVLTARLLDVWRPGAAWLCTCMAVAVSIATLALDVRSLVVTLVACFVFGWAFVAATSDLIAWVSSLIPDRAAAGTSVLFIVLTMGQAVGSALAGYLADRGGLSLAFLVAAAIAAVSAPRGAVHARPSRRRRRDSDTQRRDHAPFSRSTPATRSASCR